MVKSFAANPGTSRRSETDARSSSKEKGTPPEKLCAPSLYGVSSEFGQMAHCEAPAPTLESSGERANSGAKGVRIGARRASVEAARSEEERRENMACKDSGGVLRGEDGEKR